MKIPILCLIISFVLCILYTGQCIKINYEFEKEIGCYWELSNKSSTLSEKYKYISMFVLSLEKSNHNSHDALIFKTPNNSFLHNLNALKSLQNRLKTIESMNEKSFEYQTAIQQITGQEQGEAQSMISSLRGAWYIRNHILFYDYFCVIFMSILWTIFLVFITYVIFIILE
jgi:hypothetical protein